MDTLKIAIMDFLKSQHLMSLATLGKNINTCTVYYAPDDKFNLYFISEPDSNHCQNIAKNSSVAVAIADSAQKVTDKKRVSR